MQNYAQMYWSIRSKEVHRKIYPKYLIIVEQFEPVSQFYLILIRSFSRTAFRNMMKKIRKSEKYICVVMIIMKLFLRNWCVQIVLLWISKITEHSRIFSYGNENNYHDDYVCLFLLKQIYQFSFSSFETSPLSSFCHDELILFAFIFKLHRYISICGWSIRSKLRLEVLVCL